MRLLHTSDLVFREFFDDDVPQYAILSHKWGPLDDEISYDDFLTENKLHRPGWQKIESFCRWSHDQGYSWCWIDTCCINKDSSAELSEAINSMYAWYARSAVCVAYLRDIDDIDDDFTKSEWFCRGWTLQELIAPKDLLILTSQWEVIGDKGEKTIAKRISKQTGIPSRVLRDPRTISEISVARKMSWASQRRTTKIEDMSYCLLGLFEVNMPMLYGEGSKAFLRLQMEIIQQYDDESIFAWREQSLEVADSALRGLFAKSPSQFADCGNIVQLNIPSDDPNSSVRITRRSVEFWIGKIEMRGDGIRRDHPTYLQQLRCAQARSSDAYLDVLVTEKVLRKGSVRPCFLALSRRSESDLFSRVMICHTPWTLGGHREWDSLDRAPKESICARTSFSMDAVFDRAYPGRDPETPRAKCGKRHHQDIHESPSAPSSPFYTDDTRGSLERRTRSGQNPSSQLRNVVEPVSAPASPYYTNDTRGSLERQKRHSANRKSEHRMRDERSDYRETVSRIKDQIEEQHSNSQDPDYSEARQRNEDHYRRNDIRVEQSRSSFRQDVTQKPHNHSPKDMVDGFDPPYCSSRRRSGRKGDRTLSNPDSLAHWQAMYQELEATGAFDARRTSFDGRRPPSVPTACGYTCFAAPCTSQKGRHYAQQLRLSGKDWHDYAEKLLQSGWAFNDGP